MANYIERVIEQVKAKNPGEVEFHQTVEEVLTSLAPVIEQHPEYEVVGGYLKILDESECGQLWWDSLSERYKNIIKAMPNFDKEIFEDVTGIKI